MAVPLLFRVLSLGAELTDEPEGPTAGGNIVELYGDAFRLPYEVPAGPTSGEPLPTVEVLFGTAPALRADVVRSNFIRAIAPGSPLQSVSAGGVSSPEGPVDITIRNLDAAGVPIPGEELIVPNAYTYTRVGITAADDAVLRYIDREFILRWRRDTIENVSKGSHTEWDPDTLDDLNILSLAEIPAIVLVGPDQPENRFYTKRDHQEVEQPDGTVALVPPSRTVDLEYDVMIIADTEGQLMALVGLVRSFIRDTPYFELPRCPTDLSLGTVKYELDELDGNTTRQNRPNNSNIRTYTLTVTIRGVDIDAPAKPGMLARAETTVPVLDSSPSISFEPT